MNAELRNVKRCVPTLLATALLASTALTQTNVSEVEPNGTKLEATLASGLTAGATLTGTTTGTVTSAGNSTLGSADTFRVKTAAAPLGIYRHTLAITTTGQSAYTCQIMGVLQSNGVPQTTETQFQWSSTGTLVPNSNTWYGFGKQEELYYRVNGTSATTSAYTSTLSTAPVTPVVVPGTFTPGQIVISTWQQGHFTDTEIYLYDANLDPVPLGHNDGTQTSGIANSILTMQNLPAGTYYVSVSTYNTSNNLSDLNPDDPYISDALLDFPNVMANSSIGTNVPVTFTVTDGTTSHQQVATQVNAFDIYWARIQVGNPSTPTTIFCSGDGTGTACPCGNSGAAGNGCASSVSGIGAHLGATGIASVANDSFSLLGSNMPNSSALYFQGSAQTAGGAGIQFGDGLRCAGGSVIRLRTKINAGGSSTYPGAGEIAISIKGAISAGNVRVYQIWYRNAAGFCTAATYNLTNGLQVTWGA